MGLVVWRLQRAGHKTYVILIVIYSFIPNSFIQGLPLLKMPIVPQYHQNHATCSTGAVPTGATTLLSVAAPSYTGLVLLPAGNESPVGTT
jgi:hypothetical protein